MKSIEGVATGNSLTRVLENGEKTPLDKSFSQRLKDAVLEVNENQISADEMAQQVVKGELGIHEGMLAFTEADLSLRALLQVRTKVMDAYREIMRMPV